MQVAQTSDHRYFSIFMQIHLVSSTQRYKRWKKRAHYTADMTDDDTLILGMWRRGRFGADTRSPLGRTGEERPSQTGASLAKSELLRTKRSTQDALAIAKGRSSDANHTRAAAVTNNSNATRRNTADTYTRFQILQMRIFSKIL